MAANLRAIERRLLKLALGYPEAWEDHPWGENVAKVGKKVFVFFGVPDPREEQLIVCVKLPRSGVAALDLGFTEPAGYGLGKSGWIMARIGKGERVDQRLLEGWIEESYRAVAPKKIAALLGTAAAGAAPAPRKAKPAAKKKTAARPAKKKQRRSRT